PFPKPRLPLRSSTSPSATTFRPTGQWYRLSPASSAASARASAARCRDHLRGLNTRDDTSSCILPSVSMIFDGKETSGATESLFWLVAGSVPPLSPPGGYAPAGRGGSGGHLWGAASGQRPCPTGDPGGG